MPENRITKEPGQIWWENISGPSLFLREAVDAVYCGKHLCLVAPAMFPWRRFFFNCLKAAIREFDKDIMVEDIKGNGGVPGELIVHHFNLETEYRPTKTYPEFLRSSGALHKSILCVYKHGAYFLTFLNKKNPL